MCPTAIKTHKTAVMVYGINIFAFISGTVFDGNVEVIGETPSGRNGRTSKLTITAPNPYPICTAFNGAAAWAPHIVKMTLFPPMKEFVYNIQLIFFENLPKSVNP